MRPVHLLSFVQKMLVVSSLLMASASFTAPVFAVDDFNQPQNSQIIDELNNPQPRPASTPSPSTPTAPATPSVPTDRTIRLGQSIGGVSALDPNNALAVYIATWFRYLIGIVGLVTTIAMVYGGFRYLIGSTSGDIKAGKEIMTNAVVGMILVIMSYAILYTVNPATVSLKLPNITAITPATLTLNQVATTAANVNRIACDLDAECPEGERKCLLHDADLDWMGEISRAARAHVLRDPNATKKGFCSVGAENQPCRCSGLGCSMTNDLVGNRNWTSATTLFGLMTTHIRAAGNGLAGAAGGFWGGNGAQESILGAFSGFGSGAWGSLSQRAADVHNLSMSEVTPLTNNGGTGEVQCGASANGNMRCTYASAGGNGPDWTCRPVITRTNDYNNYVRPAETQIQRCLSDHGSNTVTGLPSWLARPDGGCPLNKACLRWDTSQTSIYGYCVDPGGAALGELCKCAGWGCALSHPDVSRKSVPCAAGLECALAKTEGSNGLGEYYFCLPPATGSNAETIGEHSQCITSNCSSCTSSAERTTCENRCNSGFQPTGGREGCRQ